MQQKQQMSAVRLAGLLAVYFIGYLWLVPRASVRLTLWLAPQALYVNTWVMGACYLVVILLSLLLSWREWKASLHAFRQAPVRCLFRIGWGCVQVLVLNVVLSMLCALLSRSRIFQLRFSRKLTFTLIHTKCQHYFFHCGRKRRIFIIVTRNRK